MVSPKPLITGVRMGVPAVLRATGSEGSIERMTEANAYAKKSGKHGFSLRNNKLSLARMVDPVWMGLPVFFRRGDARVARADGIGPLRLVQSGPRILHRPVGAGQGRCRFDAGAPLVQRRQLRAEELGAKKGVSALNIAAAYVLCQPFPSFALIGPRTINETITALPALDIELTPDGLRWLNLEDCRPMTA